LSLIDKSNNTSQMKETFGEYIRILRTSKGLTLTQLAAKLDMDSANLSKVENNKREFDEKRIIKLAKIFEINVQELRDEYYSEKFAKKIYENNCSDNVIFLAKQKIEYIKSKYD